MTLKKSVVERKITDMIRPQLECLRLLGRRISTFLRRYVNQPSQGGNGTPTATNDGHDGTNTRSARTAFTLFDGVNAASYEHDRKKISLTHRAALTSTGVYACDLDGWDGDLSPRLL